MLVMKPKHIPNDIMKIIISFQQHTGKEEFTEQDIGMQYKQLTKYTKIYNNIWGNRTLYSLQHIVKPLMMKNRNYFVEKYKIVKSGYSQTIQLIKKYDMHNDRVRNYMDHLEIYKTIHGDTIMIVSPYILPTYGGYDEMKKILDCLGWKPFPPMYAIQATTWVTKNIRYDVPIS